jgi:hypothetical protein
MILNDISRGIPHIESLPPLEFIEAVHRLGENYEATEKLDGAQLLFGLDESGFYTSRESKGGARIYNERDYEIRFPTTYMRSAHKMLESVLPKLKEAGLKIGDQVEVEVLYGELPNVVLYSKDTNYLIFLRTTEGTVDINSLKDKLIGNVMSVDLKAPFTPDGKIIALREETNIWKVARSPIIDIPKILPISYAVGGIVTYLQKTSEFMGWTNGLVESLPLNRTPVDCTPALWSIIKDDVKASRVSIRESCAMKMTHVKEILLNNLVRTRHSEFGPPKHSGGMIEGIVFKHKTTGKMIKLVDLNEFGMERVQAWSERNKLTEAARTDASAGSFLGKLNVDLAVSIGHPALGTMQAKAYVRNTGIVLEDISKNISFNETKSYVSRLLEVSRNDLSSRLDKYCAEKRYSPAIDVRTKETFASLFEKISSLQLGVKRARSSNDLVRLLVGKHLGEI